MRGQNDQNNNMNDRLKRLRRWQVLVGLRGSVAPGSVGGPNNVKIRVRSLDGILTVKM